MVDREPAPDAAVHRAVLRDEVVEWLAPREGSMIVDGTVGAGGHAAALAERVGTTGRVIGLDRDPSMLTLAAKATEGQPVTLVNSSYRDLGAVLRSLQIEAVDGIVLDLGLSSDQLQWEHRGFSFARDGPLDMRYDPETPESAADLIRSLSAEDLADLFYEYGEERHSRRVARRIVEAREHEPILTTGQLAQIVRRAIPGKWGPIDPSTRVFQALRIAVNRELEHLDSALADLPNWLKPSGRAAIISFHSLEDRRVKVAFRDNPELRPLTKKPIVASDDELQLNPRARSAKLRVAERCTRPIGTESTINLPPIPPKTRPKRRRRR